MVAISKRALSGHRGVMPPLGILLTVFLTFYAIITLPDWDPSMKTTATLPPDVLAHEQIPKRVNPVAATANQGVPADTGDNEPPKTTGSSSTHATTTPASKTMACPYQTWSDLKSEEQYPAAGPRHMVDPPADTTVTLVCCQTTAGPWNIAVHHAWAPKGAARFLEMVAARYFADRTVPLMRCVNNFLCQFGLAGPASRHYAATLPDDQPWLPQGRQHRANAQGIRRFAKGYLAYAGAGKHSRNNQFFVALKPNGPLAGGAPWEVPWGELVGAHSYETLDKITTEYGENVKQGRLWKEDYRKYIQENFPKLDWIESCVVTDERKVTEDTA